MSATKSRTGGCGCSGSTYAPRGAELVSCGCEEKGPREVLGGCECERPERCGVACLERPLYSAGQLLTADSLRLGQTYVEGRFALRRFVDGVGVVCGMHVRCDPEHPGWVLVDPGYAIDCCGHDIVLCEPVRFNVCKAIKECKGKPDPCEPLEQPPPKAPPQASSSKPTNPAQEADRGTITGTVCDAESKQVLPGASVSVAGTNLSATTDPQGIYRIKLPLGLGSYTVTAALIGYAPVSQLVNFSPSQTTVAKFWLTPTAVELPTSSTSLNTYVLRLERAWEGRAPVPVVNGRGGCDPAPSCRPSKEVGSVRLCVTRQEASLEPARVRDRTTKFKTVGSLLLQRINEALEAREALPQSEKEKIPQALVVANVLLAAIRDEPLRTSCNLVDLICEVRRLIEGKGARCFDFPSDVGLGTILAGLLGQLIDDLREEYLMRGCDDCCEHTGVRLAHIVTQDLLATCGQNGCSIAGIDTHAPAREALHPRSSWWVADMVVVHDAYFRGVNEAGVLLTGRGLRVTPQPIESGPTPAIPDEVKEWLKANDGGDELARLAVYLQSVLYARFGTAVTLWTVEGRVLAITADGRASSSQAATSSLRSYAFADYLRHPFTPASGEPIESTAITQPGAALDPAEMDPAPLRELISGVGVKTEEVLFRQGRTTLASVLDTKETDVAGMIRPDLLHRIQDRARRILEGAVEFPAEDLEQWAAAARIRKEQVERSRK